MPNRSTDRPAIIAIYNTREGGEVVTKNSLDKIIHSLTRPGIKSPVITQIITAADIRSGYLDFDHVIGLFMPGRNRGKHYRDELGTKGYIAIHNAVQNGLSAMTICAASYVMSKQTYFHTEYGNPYVARAQNKYALFDGKCTGAIHELWKENYSEIIPEGQEFSTEIHRESGLPFSIVKITYNNKPMSIAYGGGGRFIPNNPDEVKILATHDQTHDKTPAIIEVSCGKGLAILSNVHPESQKRLFEFVFRNSKTALQDPENFEKDLADLGESENQRCHILKRFILNCAWNCKARVYDSAIIKNYGLV